MTNESDNANCDGFGLFVIVAGKSCSDTRKLLQRYDLYDATRKIEKCDEDNNMMAVPLKGSTCNSTTEINLENVKLRTKLIKLSSRKEKMSPCQTLQSNLKHLVGKTWRLGHPPAEVFHGFKMVAIGSTGLASGCRIIESDPSCTKGWISDK